MKRGGEPVNQQQIMRTGGDNSKGNYTYFYQQ